MKLKGKVAVITGGSSGIGFAIAREFSQHGAKIVIFGRKEDRLKDSLLVLSPEATYVVGDVTRLADVETLYDRVSELHSGIDILVASAGCFAWTPLSTTDEELFDHLSNTNFKGVYFSVQRAIPHLNRGASVILISSFVHALAGRDISAYSATKAAVRSLARTFSSDLIPHGIRVNCISPGPIDTPLFQTLNFSNEKLKDMKQLMAKRIPMKRMGRAQEIASAALFLASAESSYMSGQDLVLDGGSTGA